VVTPAKTPKETTDQLVAMLTAALAAPDVKAKFIAQGLYPVGQCGAAFAAHLKAQHAQYAQVIRDANIKGE
jgi:tripartite-type tricarboxylate transporter receptor subunit TctC